MSFLLDALRKSERAAQRRSAPTIHSDTRVEQPADANESEILPLMAFLVPAFVLMSWFGLQQFSSTTSTGGESDAVNRQAAAGPVARETQAERPVAGGASPPTEVERPPGQTATGQGAPSPRPRTPVEQLTASADQAGQDAGQGSGQGQAGPGAPPSLPEDPPEDPLEAASRAIEEAMASESVQEGQPASRPGTQPGGGAQQARPAAQNHINYWELPDNIRAELPKFRISVSVYAEKPADRFILINGRRLYQGEELQSGLVLREVQREGVIFSYRRYRFMISR